MAEKPTKKVLLRLPEARWKALKRMAQKANRSLHGQILEILDTAASPTNATTTGSNTQSITLPEPETVTA